MDFWAELVCEDELRIIDGKMIVPNPVYTSTSYPSYSGPTLPPSTRHVSSGVPVVLEPSIHEREKEAAHARARLPSGFQAVEGRVVAAE